MGVADSGRHGSQVTDVSTRIVVLTASVLSLGAVAAIGAPVGSGIDAFIEHRMASTGTPGLALAVIRDDEIVHVRGYGEAAADRPVGPDTPFLLASVSKSFTAVALLQLVDDGRVDLDAPVRRYLPDFRTADAATSGRITVRHVLNQTSGMSDAGFPHMTLPQPASIAERVASLTGARLTSEPGARFQYFDPNYAVAARIVEVVSGEPFDAHLREHVLEPLGMGSTTSVVRTEELGATVPALAQGHVVAFGPAVPWREMDGYLAGSSGVVSTADDMARYLAFQAGASPGSVRILPAGLLALTQAPTAGVDGAYGMGWELVDGPDGTPVLHHSGVLGTFHADIVVVPGERLGIALLYNASHALADYDGVWRGVLDLIDERPAPGASVDARPVEIAFGILTALAVLLRLRGIRRFGVAGPSRAWLRVARMAWAIVPAVVLASLSSIVAATSERVFSFGQLLLAMPGPVIWLGVNAAIGLVQAALLVRGVRVTSAPPRSTLVLEQQREADR